MSGARSSTNSLQRTGRIFNEVRNLFQTTFLKRANSNSQAAIWRRKTARQLLSGNATPFLALVGVTLASGPGIVTKQDELEFVCKEIRRSARKTLYPNDNEQYSEVAQNDSEEISDGFDCMNIQDNAGYSWSLKDFEIGSIIAKGCNAVVQAAKVKDTLFNRFEGARNTFKSESHNRETRSLDVESKPQNETPSISIIEPEESLIRPNNKANETLNKYKPRTPKDEMETDDASIYPLAIKQMFNYDIESNAHIIFRAMYREIVIARDSSLPDEVVECTRGLHSRRKTLPPHPNIIEMPLAFTDFVQQSSGAMDLYPDALPQRLNPNGLGRNMSLFLVMKRYDCTLREYIQRSKKENGELALTWKTSLVLLTQLLEGINHMVQNEIAHRDLKSDNILIHPAPPLETMLLPEARSNNYQFPHLVISDFGCCLADSKDGLKLPYTSYETDRGGNIALMAPEVLNAVPGMFASIDYSKADVWSAGAIAYELFGATNPFYTHRPKGSKKGNKYFGR